MVVGLETIHSIVVVRFVAMFKSNMKDERR